MNTYFNFIISNILFIFFFNIDYICYTLFYSIMINEINIEQEIFFCLIMTNVVMLKQLLNPLSIVIVVRIIFSSKYYYLLQILTRAFRPFDIRTRLVPDQQPRVLGTSLYRGNGIPAVTMTAVVRECVRWLEWTLHGITRLPKHGVKESVASNQWADGLQRAHFVAKGCKPSSIVQ